MQPIFNIPRLLSKLIFLLIAMHLVKYMLIGGMIALDGWLGQQLLTLFDGFLLVPSRVLSPDFDHFFSIYTSLLTHGLLHVDLMHLIANIGFLLAFGVPLFHRLKPFGWFLLLMLSIIGGGLAYVFFTSNPDIPAVGISGGVSGLMGAILRPSLIHSRYLPIEQPFKRRGNAAVMLMVFIAFNLLSAISIQGTSVLGLIAWQAHFGGFITGFMLYPAIWRSQWK